MAAEDAGAAAEHAAAPAKADMAGIAEMAEDAGAEGAGAEGAADDRWVLYEGTNTYNRT